MGISNRLKDTTVSLQRAQVARERALKADERLTARRILEMHAKRHKWTREEVETVIEALGLD